MATWIRFAQVAAGNRPPLRMLVLPGEEPWPDLELLRVRCGFNGQFLAVGERVWIPCSTGPKRWELIRWDFPRGVAQRKWRARCSPKDSSSLEVVQQSSLHLPPAIAAAIQLPVGDLALVLHAPKRLTPVELVVARREGGLTHHPLPFLKPGLLVGFAYVSGRYELLTADCRRHVLELGKPLVSSPLAGCPYDGKTVLEWSQHTPKGWRFAYARKAQQPGRYSLHLVQPGETRASPLGTLLEPDGKRRGQKLDLSAGNVLPVATSQWPSHRLLRGVVSPLEPPPKKLTQGLRQVSSGGGHLFSLGTGSILRLPQWHGLTLAPATPHQAKMPNGPRTITRWRWFVRLPTRWIGGETSDRGTTLRLVASAPERTTELPLPRAAPSALKAIPAKGGGAWLFDSRGTYLRVDDGLRRIDTPGLWQRVIRIWRLHHLQRDHLAGRMGRPVKQSALTGLAHRAALPVVLTGLPLLALLALPWAWVSGRRRDPKRPLRASLARMAWPWLVSAALYLVAATTLLWSFWRVTTAF